jgi:hypothetical protein
MTDLLASTPLERIDTIEGLRQHLQCAIELEHTTIPPYLCALYTLDPQRNAEAVEVLTSVLVEEMLHLGLAANLLNAVGGAPVIDHPRLLAPYPRCLPHGVRSLEVALLPFGREALDLFLRIEQPAPLDGPTEDEGYETISQFYAAIETGLRALVDQHGEAAVFGGDPSRQLTDAHFRPGSGRMIVVTDLATAIEALGEIVEQGEGADHSEVWDGTTDMFHPERQQVAHYYRFEELLEGRRYAPGDIPGRPPSGEAIAVDWDAVHPMQPNPTDADDDRVAGAQYAFDDTYSSLLGHLQETFDGHPDRIERALGAMFALRTHAVELLGLPSGVDGEHPTTAGPTFHWVEPEDRSGRS